MNLPPLLDIERAIYKRSYYEFFKEAFVVLHPGDKYSDNWHVREFCDLMQAEFQRMADGREREKNIIINTPFRSAKSLIFSVIFQAWAWSVRPETKFICVSFSESLAVELAGLSRNLMASEWYQSRWSDQWKYTKTAVTHFENDKGGFRKSVGTGGQITGSGADMIILDDPQDPQLAASATERNNTITYFRGTLYSRINNLDVGSRIIVQQRLHEDDLTGNLTKNDPELYEHYCVPAVLSDALRPKSWSKYYVDELFWPSRFSPKLLQEFLKTLGSKGYANQLLQKSSPEEGGILKEKWFKCISWDDFYALTRGKEVVWEVDLDLAYTEKKHNDPSACMVSALVENVLYIRRAEPVHMEAPQLMRYIQEIADKEGLTNQSRVHVEPKGPGLTIMQLLRAETKLNPVSAPTKMPDKITRASTAAPFIEGGRVVMLDGGWCSEFVEQCKTFPHATHDDMVDTLSQAVARAQLPAKRQRVMSS